MAKPWILRGAHAAPGAPTNMASRNERKTDRFTGPPQKTLPRRSSTTMPSPTDYEDLHAEEAADGMYIDPNGTPLFLVGGTIVASAEAVVETLGQEAQDLLADVGEGIVVLERLGKVF